MCYDSFEILVSPNLTGVNRQKHEISEIITAHGEKFSDASADPNG